MAWEYPKHACGHDGERVQMYGKMDGRRVQLARIEAQDCSDCRRKSADKISADAGLPTLTGSDKQVAWAVSIRQKLWLPLAELKAKNDAFIARLEAKDYHDEKTTEQIDACRIELTTNAARLAEIMAQTRASWWIDRRNNNATMLLVEGRTVASRL